MKIIKFIAQVWRRLRDRLAPDFPYRDDCVLTHVPRWRIDGKLANPWRRPILHGQVRDQLESMGIRTVGQIRQAPDRVLLERLSTRSLAELRSLTAAPADMDSYAWTMYVREMFFRASREEAKAARRRHPDLVEAGVEIGVYPEGTVASADGLPVIPASAWRAP